MSKKLQFPRVQGAVFMSCFAQPTTKPKEMQFKTKKTSKYAHFSRWNMRIWAFFSLNE